MDDEIYLRLTQASTHQQMSGNLLMMSDSFVGCRGLGKIIARWLDVTLSDHDVLQPDIVSVPRDRKSIVTKDRDRGDLTLVAGAADGGIKHVW